MPLFSEFKLSESLMKAVEEMGYTTPSPIQEQAIPMLLEEPTDFLGLAATGTGKTAAFGLPMLEAIDSAIRAPQALILCPTRELALQVAGQIAKLGKHKKVKPVAIYGGASYTEQIAGLRSGAQVVVGTPGRTVDHIEKGTLKLDKVKVVILDEADEMISMGFKDDLETILKAVRGEGQGEDANKSNIWLFSATMSKEVRRVANDYLRQPKQVQVNNVEKVPSTIEQLYFPVREGDKPEVLGRLIEAAEDFYGLVFCQTKTLVVDLTQHLIDKGYKVDCLHGDKDQKARERTMQAFRDRRVSILICTDVASRGLDVKDVTHVVNYSLPRELDNYVHRIGRTARSGKTGIAISLVTQSHRHLLRQIENMTKSQIKEGTIPSRREVGAKKVTAMLAGFQAQTMHTRVGEVMGEDWKTALAAMNSEEVASRFLAMMMPDVFSDKKRAEDFHSMMNNSVTKPRDGGGDRRGGGGYGGDRRERTFGSAGGGSSGPGGGGYRDRGPRGGGFDRGPRGGDDRGPRASFGGPSGGPSAGPSSGGPSGSFSAGDRAPRAERVEMGVISPVPKADSPSKPAAAKPTAPTASAAATASSTPAREPRETKAASAPAASPAGLFAGRPARKSRFASEIRGDRDRAPLKKARPGSTFSARSERPPRAERSSRTTV